MSVRGSYINYNEEFKEQDFFDELEFYRERYNIIINSYRLNAFKETLSYGAHYAEKLDTKQKEFDDLDEQLKIDNNLSSVNRANEELRQARFDRHKARISLRDIAITDSSKKNEAIMKLFKSINRVKVAKVAKKKADYSHEKWMEKYNTTKAKIAKYSENVENAKQQKEKFKKNVQEDIQIYINARCLNNFLYQHQSTYGNQLTGLKFLVDYLDFCQKHTNKNGKVTIEIGDPQNKADINYLKNLTANYERPLFNRYPNSLRAQALNQAKLSFQNNLDQEKADYIKDLRDYEGR